MVLWLIGALFKINIFIPSKQQLHWIKNDREIEFQSYWFQNWQTPCSLLLWGIFLPTYFRAPSFCLRAQSRGASPISKCDCHCRSSCRDPPSQIALLAKQTTLKLLLSSRVMRYGRLPLILHHFCFSIISWSTILNLFTVNLFELRNLVSLSNISMILTRFQSLEEFATV